jgi:hypothetical protein
MQTQGGLMLTDDEREAIRMGGEWYTHIANKVCGMGVTREADLAELTGKIHDIQHLVMAQSAARDLPGELRLMGEVVGWQAPPATATSPNIGAYRPVQLTSTPGSK